MGSSIWPLAEGSQWFRQRDQPTLDNFPASSHHYLVDFKAFRGIATLEHELTWAQRTIQKLTKELRQQAVKLLGRAAKR